MTRFDTVSTSPDLVGESPFWHATEESLYWVDIVGKTIRRLNREGAIETWQTDDFPTAIAMIAGSEDAVVSFGRGLGRFSFSTGETQTLCAPHGDDVTMRLNEGKCDPQGRFWSASMDNNLHPDGSAREMGEPRGILMRLSSDGTYQQFGSADLGIPNTMAWSPDRKTFYFGDTLRNTIWAYDYDDNDGVVSNRRVLIEGGPGLPDGSGIDADGCLWNARFSGGCLLRITPDGKVDRQLDLPRTNPTACTFGGSGFQTLFVTSGSFGLDADQITANPDEGKLIAVDVGVSGVPENYFRR